LLVTSYKDLATAQQTEKFSDSESSDDDDAKSAHKKKSSKAHQASTTSGAGLLSGSYKSDGRNQGGGGGGGGGGTAEGKKLKKRTSRLGDVEWVAASWGEERVKAVVKGIDKSAELCLCPSLTPPPSLSSESMKWLWIKITSTPLATT
jgi:hypothetical protein